MPEQTCKNCGSANVVKSGFDQRRRQRFLCKDCGSIAAEEFKSGQGVALKFKGGGGKVYTVKIILMETKKRGHPVSANTAIYRIKAAIKDPTREDSLFDPPGNKPNNFWKRDTEKLTPEQRETMADFRAVHDRKMTLNELLEK